MNPSRLTTGTEDEMLAETLRAVDHADATDPGWRERVIAEELWGDANIGTTHLIPPGSPQPTDVATLVDELDKPWTRSPEHGPDVWMAADTDEAAELILWRSLNAGELTVAGAR